MWQVMIYHPLLRKVMNFHCDNYTVESVRRMSRGETEEAGSGSWGGLSNSQQLGTDVIVFSYGNCPMKMVFKVMNSREGAMHRTDMYEIEPTSTFTFELMGGYINILDAVSDTVMQHSLTFTGLKLKIKGRQKF